MEQSMANVLLQDLTIPPLILKLSDRVLRREVQVNLGGRQAAFRTNDRWLCHGFLLPWKLIYLYQKFHFMAIHRSASWL
jgi:hypothetical protein